MASDIVSNQEFKHEEPFGLSPDSRNSSLSGAIHLEWRRLVTALNLALLLRKLHCGSAGKAACFSWPTGCVNASPNGLEYVCPI